MAFAMPNFKHSSSIDIDLNHTKLSFILRCIAIETVVLKWESGAHILCNTGAAPATVSGMFYKHEATGNLFWEGSLY